MKNDCWFISSLSVLSSVFFFSDFSKNYLCAEIDLPIYKRPDAKENYYIELKGLFSVY